MKQLFIILLLLVCFILPAEVRGIVYCEPFEYFDTMRTWFTIVLMVDIITSIVCYVDRVDMVRISPLYLVPDEIKEWRIPVGVAFGLTTNLAITQVYKRNKLLGNILYTLLNSAYTSITARNWQLTFIIRPRI